MFADGRSDVFDDRGDGFDGGVDVGDVLMRDTHGPDVAAHAAEFWQDDRGWKFKGALRLLAGQFRSTNKVASDRLLVLQTRTADKSL